MLEISHLRELVIRPALEALHLYSEAAEELVLGTALQESGLRYLKQLGDGPALGLWQMEPRTHDDIWLNFLSYEPGLAGRVRSLCATPISEALAGNLWYAAGMCRVHYFRVAEALPAAGDISAQAGYWKRWYNTPRGAGTVEEYLAKWNKWAGTQ